MSEVIAELTRDYVVTSQFGWKCAWRGVSRNYWAVMTFVLRIQWKFAAETDVGWDGCGCCSNLGLLCQLASFRGKACFAVRLGEDWQVSCPVSAGADQCNLWLQGAFTPPRTSVVREWKGTYMLGFLALSDDILYCYCNGIWISVYCSITYIVYI